MIFVGGRLHGQDIEVYKPLPHKVLAGPDISKAPETYVDMLTAETYYRRQMITVITNPASGLPTAAYKAEVFMHERLPPNTPFAHAAVSDAVLRQWFATTGEEVPVPGELGIHPTNHKGESPQ